MKTGLLVLSLFFLLSCKSNDRKAEITHLVNEWQGKEILFPDSITFTTYATDTTDVRFVDAPFKVIIYTDSIGCISCKLQLNKWKEFIQEADSLTGGEVPFLFFLETRNHKEMNHTLRRERFSLPVCIDDQGTMQKLNRFPDSFSFRTFLLDRDNRVVLIGNPVLNMAMKELYLNEIKSFYNEKTSLLPPADPTPVSQTREGKELFATENRPYLSHLSFSNSKKKQKENTHIGF